jgi:hypothetical protein
MASANSAAYLLGLDIGTTATKGIVLHPERGIVAQAEAPATLVSPKPGWAEADPLEWWRNVRTVARACLHEAQIRAEDIAACLALPAGSVDVVLSHDCPQGIGMTNAPGFGHFGPPGFAGGREIAAHLQPRLWIFGHHHRWFDRTHGATRYLGLPESWKGFALLGHHGDLRVIDHFLDSPSTFWSRLTTWCQRLLGRESS